MPVLCNPIWGTPLNPLSLGRIPNRVGDLPEAGCFITVDPIQYYSGTGYAPPGTQPPGLRSNPGSVPSHLGGPGTTGILLSSTACMPPTIIGRPCSMSGRSSPPFSSHCYSIQPYLTSLSEFPKLPGAVMAEGIQGSRHSYRTTPPSSVPLSQILFVPHPPLPPLLPSS